MAPQGYQPPGSGAAGAPGAVGHGAAGPVTGAGSVDEAGPVAPGADVVVVGAGAAGLFAATIAARAQRAAGREVSVLALDGARRIGAKILVSGGGRCNVTHWQVGAADYAGSTAPAIRKVLGRFGVDRTVAFFREQGVEFYREADTGKLFPTTDSARTILDALLGAAAGAGVRVVHPAAVTALVREAVGFRLETAAGAWTARRVILATGGQSLPKSGSDGSGFALAAALGHGLARPIVPALVPLVLPGEHWIRGLSGLALPCRFRLVSGQGKIVAESVGSTLCTHTGLSGPATLDISRHWLVSRLHDPAARLLIDWLPALDAAAVERVLLDAGARGILAALKPWFSERLVRCLCAEAGATPTGDLPREARRRLVGVVKGMDLAVSGDRGWNVAEATAGGVPLAEVRLDSMESRICAGVHFAGELLDVDGRIGGFNFQWAWASGFTAGSAAGGADRG